MIRRKPSVGSEIAVGITLILVLSMLCYGVFVSTIYNWQWARANESLSFLWRGWLRTLGISVGALVVSVLIGVVLMLAKRSQFRTLRSFSAGYIELVRGMPLLVFILLGYYVFAKSLPLPRALTTDWIVGPVLLALFSGAYLAEIFRGGVDSIEGSQIEAARAVGFDSRQAYRFVIIPQAMRRVLPATTGQFIDLVKNSSLLGVVGISELFREAENAASRTYGPLEAYVPMAIAYLIVTIPLAWFARWLERRLHYES